MTTLAFLGRVGTQTLAAVSLVVPQDCTSVVALQAAASPAQTYARARVYHSHAGSPTVVVTNLLLGTYWQNGVREAVGFEDEGYGWAIVVGLVARRRRRMLLVGLGVWAAAPVHGRLAPAGETGVGVGSER